jgi:drug/metabolite transporter (DMT)-like permease
MFFYCLTQLPLGNRYFIELHMAAFLSLCFRRLILKEQLHWPLICTVLLGFVGVVLLLRPSLPEDHWVAGLMGMASGFFAALAYINVKQLGNLGESEWHVVFYFTLISTLITGVHG